MLPLIRIYLALLACTATDGGIGTIFSPFLNDLRYPVDQIGFIMPRRPPAWVAIQAKVPNQNSLPTLAPYGLEKW